MSDRFIPLSVPNIRGNEIKYVTEALEAEWVSTAGPFITKFEEQVANYLRMITAVACQSGTSGLHLALQTCGVSKDDEVIVPTLTFIAAVNPVKYLGAHPIFMDCDDTLTIDPIKVRQFCEEECEFADNVLINKNTGRRVVAMVVVHVFGNLVDMEQIVDIANEYNLRLIEDATEALGSKYIEGRYIGKYAGTIGDLGVYSFNGNKIITTGGGGMIVGNDLEALEHCRSLSTQSKRDTLFFDHSEIGYNYRMTNIQAAIGIAQFEQLEAFIEHKKKLYDKYNNLGIKLMPFRSDIRSNYWFFSYLTDKRDELMYYLHDNNVQTRPIWKLIHTQDMYVDCQAYKIEKANYYYDRVLNLPCSSNLDLEDVEYISELILSKEGE